jgi:phosphoribosylanthranilate isomerase
MAPLVRVKICGINSPAAYEAAVGAGADWVGFVFFPPSPRFVTPAQAAALAQPGGVDKAGLFVDPSDDDIAATLAGVDLDILQLVGTLPARAAEIRRRFGRPVWRAVGIGAAADLPTDPGGVDAHLLDAKAAPGACLPGGNAIAFDWSLLLHWAAPAPWVLAGGLTPGTVAAAIAQTGAPIVDVSSGVESSRGVKDPTLIRSFLSEARGMAPS